MTAFESISQYDFLINCLSCVGTILALVFTLYLWLLGTLSDDEAKFLEGKKEFLSLLYNSMSAISESKEPEVMLPLMQDINDHLEVIMNYRFWQRTKRKEDFMKINTFYQDSKYLISTLRRCLEVKDNKELKRSLVSVNYLNDEEKADIRDDYRKGLSFIIEFVENWN